MIANNWYQNKDVKLCYKQLTNENTFKIIYYKTFTENSIVL